MPTIGQNASNKWVYYNNLPILYISRKVKLSITKTNRSGTSFMTKDYKAHRLYIKLHRAIKQNKNPTSIQKIQAQIDLHFANKAPENTDTLFL
jgi:hypothetical protein